MTDRQLYYTSTNGSQPIETTLMKFKIGQTAQCRSGNGVQDVTHILQSSSLYAKEGAETWPNPSPEDPKLHGSQEDLQRTAAFIC